MMLRTQGASCGRGSTRWERELWSEKTSTVLPLRSRYAQWNRALRMAPISRVLGGAVASLWLAHLPPANDTGLHGPCSGSSWGRCISTAPHPTPLPSHCSAKGRLTSGICRGGVGTQAPDLIKCCLGLLGPYHRCAPCHLATPEPGPSSLQGGEVREGVDGGQQGRRPGRCSTTHPTAAAQLLTAPTVSGLGLSSTLPR